MGVPTEERLRRYAREKEIEDAGDKVAVIEVCFRGKSGRSVEASGTSAYSQLRKFERLLTRMDSLIHGR